MKLKTCLFAALLAVFALLLLPNQAQAAEIVQSGTCGENLTWTLDSDGTLTISGQGEMRLFTEAAWLAYRQQIRSVVVEEGVTNVSSHAFDGCENLTSVTLAESVTSLGNYAFANCTSLKEFTFGDQFIFIYDDIFNGCTALEKVHLGAGIRVIYSHAFRNCPALTTLTINPDNPHFVTDEKSVIYTKDYSELVLFPAGFTGDYAVRPGTKSIRQHAANGCFGLTGLTFPESLSEINNLAFYGCTNLRSVTFSYGLYELDHECFSNCTSLKTLILPGSLNCLGNSVFAGCTALETVDFRGEYPQMCGYKIFVDVTATIYYPEGLKSWERIGEKFWGVDLTWQPRTISCDHPVQVRKGKAPTCTWPGWSDTTYCGVCLYTISKQKELPATGHIYGDWVEVKAPTPTENGIAERCCKYCDDKETKSLPTTETNGSCGEHLTWQLENNVLTISGTGDMYTYHDSNEPPYDTPPWMKYKDIITKIVIEEGVTSISHKAFLRFPVLKTVEMADSVAIIGGQAFGWCEKLSDIRLPANLKVIPDFLFNGCVSLTSITVPETVTYIDIGAFSNCTGLKSVYFRCSALDRPYQIFFSSTEWGQMNVTAYYPANDTSWTEENRPTHDGHITWVATCYDRHTYGTNWKTDSENHWRTCAYCDKKEDAVKHSFDNGCDPKCNACGYTRDASHTYGTEWVTDENEHWYVCVHCGTKKSVAAHSYDNDCDAACNTCSYTRQPSHAFGEEWQHDTTGHWHTCSVCNGKDEIHSHTWNEGEVTKEVTCTEAGLITRTCTVCNATRVDAIDKLKPHTYGEDHLCTGCGVKDPTAPEPTEPAVDTPAEEESKPFPIAVIVIAIVLLAAGAAAGVVIWKKKK